MSRKLLAGTLLLSAGIMALVFGLTSPRPIYARSVSQFLAEPVRERTVRVTGRLVPGSLCRMSQACEYNFSLTDRWPASAESGTRAVDQELPVRYPACVIPDTLREVPGMDLEVSMEGELCANCHRFEATQLMVKCPSVYRRNSDGSHWVASKVPTCLAN
jgi:cytochrome c-type biogenesis protein CcmE